MKARVLMISGITVILLPAAVAISAEILRGPLDQLWEQHMLDGKRGAYMNGEPEAITAPAFSFAKERAGKGAGSPQFMVFTEYGISVQDFRETKLFGLLSGGGWTLRGGLLERIEIDPVTVELYGKIVDRIHPGLLDHYYHPKEERSYEFFFLRRKRDVPQAVILKKWIVEPEHVRWQNATSDVRGHLQYDPAIRSATVIISGLKVPFQELVDLSKALRE